MNAVTEFVRALGPSRIAAMGAVAVGLIGFFAFLVFRFSQPQMAVLFTELPFEDSTAIVRRLEGLNVPHEVRQDGAVILVPKQQMLKIRMRLAEDGLPAGGTVGYEIFDKGDTLGATSFVQNINQLRAIEGELGRTIRSLRQVKMARVHLVMPQRKLFSRQKAQPSASIVVSVRGTLESGQIRAIQHLVASAVEGLTPSNISIVDERGKLLASGRGEGEDAVTAEAADERNRAFELRMQHQIEDIIGSVVGPNRARVRVTAELDYTQTQQTSEVFDPDGQVVRSSVTRTENNLSNQASGNDAVSVGNELPSASNNDGTNGSTRETASKNEETVNYEISRTQKTQLIAAGRVKRISVAVLVDGIYKKDTAGKVVYSPRSQTELEEITKLVRSAIGFDRERGDQVHISNLRFADNATPQVDEQGEPSMFDLSKDDYFYIAELVVTLIVSLFVLLFVVRPLVRRILTPDEERQGGGLLASPGQDGAQGGQQMAQIAGPNGAVQASGEGGANALVPPPNKTSEMLELAKISGEIHASAIREVGEIIAGNPEDAVTIIRDWMDADAA